MIRIYEPYLTESTKKYAHDAIESGWISSQGSYIAVARESLASLMGVKHCVLLSNGTTATHCLSKGLNFKYPKIKNLIVPNNVYVAAWNSFLHDGQYEDITAIDACEDTWNYNLDKLYKTLEEVDFDTTALLCVHNLGNIINIPKIKRDFPSLVIVEDNCEGFLGKYENSYSGTQSFCASVSFYANKNITSGEGGAFFTNCDETYHYISSFINQGNTKEKFIHDKLSQNYRMTNIQAALLLGQIEDLELIREKKNVIFEKYKQKLPNIDNVTIQSREANTDPADWMMGVRVTNGKTYSTIESELKSMGVETRPMFYCYNRHKHLKKIIKSETNKVAEHLSLCGFMIPSHPLLSEYETDFIIDSIAKISK